jgi:hypothetical protein
MSLEAMTQTEVKDPSYKHISDSILAITSGGREQGHDQETIRVMLHTFGQAASSSSISNSALDGPCEVRRRY